jgi:hypothetical protein
LPFVRTGKPIERVYIKCVNSKFRDERLNEHRLVPIALARRATEAWRIECNTGATRQLTVLSDA